MVNRNLIREFDITEEEEEFAIGDAMPDDLDWLKGGDVGPNQIVEGRVLRIDDDFVLVDVGYKSEGIIPRNEWEEGDEIPQGRRDDPRARRRHSKTSPASTTIAA